MLLAGGSAVDVEEDANGARQGAWDRDLAGADHGNPVPAALHARGAGGKVGVEIVGHREDRPDDLVLADVVRLVDGAAELGHSLLHGGDGVVIELRRTADAAHREPNSVGDPPGRFKDGARYPGGQ